MYDEYTVAYKDRSLVLDPLFSNKAGNGIFNPNILINGQIKGTWRRELKNDVVQVEIHYFSSLGKSIEKAVASMANRYAKYLGKELELTTF